MRWLVVMPSTVLDLRVRARIEQNATVVDAASAGDRQPWDSPDSHGLVEDDTFAAGFARRQRQGRQQQGLRRHRLTRMAEQIPLQ